VSLITINLQVFADETRVCKLINDRSREIMETLATLNQKLDDLDTAQEAERAEVMAALKELKDRGGPITQADMDAIGLRLDAARAKAQGIITPEDTAA